MLLAFYIGQTFILLHFFIKTKQKRKTRLIIIGPIIIKERRKKLYQNPNTSPTALPSTPAETFHFGQLGSYIFVSSNKKHQMGYYFSKLHFCCSSKVCHVVFISLSIFADARLLIASLIVLHRNSWVTTNKLWLDFQFCFRFWVEVF